MSDLSTTLTLDSSGVQWAWGGVRGRGWGTGEGTGEGIQVGTGGEVCGAQHHLDAGQIWGMCEVSWAFRDVRGGAWGCAWRCVAADMGVHVGTRKASAVGGVGRDWG